MTEWNPIAGQDPVDRLDLDEPGQPDIDYGLCTWCLTIIDKDGYCACGAQGDDQ